MTGRTDDRLHFFLSIAPTGTKCNRNGPRPVINSGVDAISTTWMILMQALWLQLRFSMMMRRLANWFAVSIRLSQKWCAPIDRDALLKRTFAK